MKMKLLGMLIVGTMVLTGCAAQLSDADRALLNKAVDSGRSGTQVLQAAEAAAARAEQAAVRSESAATRAEQAAAQSDVAAKGAEASASQAASQAGQAQQNALKAEKAFEMKIRK